MKLEDQLANLELSKKLKELGVKQESYFKYQLREDGNLEIFHSKATSCAHEYYSAFTVAEIGEMLPKGGWTQESTYGGYRVWAFDKKPPHKEKAYTWDAKESDARAKMLVFLIENGSLEVPK
jgi:hypothetical protein